MAKKFILLIKTENRKVCYGGEGTENQVRKDIGQLEGKVTGMEVYPVISGRFQKESLLAGILGTLVLGTGIFLTKKYYESLRKRCRKQG